MNNGRWKISCGIAKKLWIDSNLRKSIIKRFEHHILQTPNFEEKILF